MKKYMVEIKLFNNEYVDNVCVCLVIFKIRIYMRDICFFKIEV